MSYIFFSYTVKIFGFSLNNFLNRAKSAHYFNFRPKGKHPKVHHQAYKLTDDKLNYANNINILQIISQGAML